MANQKISQMPAAASLTGAELVELVQSGVNVQSTAAAIAALASVSGGPILSVLESPIAYTSTTALAATGLITPALVLNGWYAVDGLLVVEENTSSAGGFKFDFNAGTVTVNLNNFGFVDFSNIATAQGGHSLSTAFSLATIGVAGFSMLRLSGAFQAASAGTLGIRAAQNTSSANTTNLRETSYLSVTRLA